MFRYFYTIGVRDIDNYKDRMRKEYADLKWRMDSLRTMLDKYAAGALDFTPHCSYELLLSQYMVMQQYATILEQRAIIEGVEL